jgi:TRAP-type C4-dicarboxylate transport system permease small subunit
VNPERKFPVRKGFDRLLTGLSFIGTVWIFVMMLIIVYDVAARNFFHAPFTGTAEIIRNTIVIILFLQITDVLRKGHHIRTNVIYDRLPEKGKLVLLTLACLLGAILFGFMTYVSWGPAMEALLSKQYEGEGAMRVPTFPARFAIVLGSALMCIQYLVMIYDAFRYRKLHIDEDANVNL